MEKNINRHSFLQKLCEYTFRSVVRRLIISKMEKGNFLSTIFLWTWNFCCVFWCKQNKFLATRNKKYTFLKLATFAFCANLHYDGCVVLFSLFLFLIVVTHLILLFLCHNHCFSCEKSAFFSKATEEKLDNYEKFEFSKK